MDVVDIMDRSDGSDGSDRSNLLEGALATKSWGPPEFLSGVGAVHESTEAIVCAELFAIKGYAGKISFGEFDAWGGAFLVVGVEKKTVQAVFRVVVHGEADAFREVGHADIVVKMWPIGRGLGREPGHLFGGKDPRWPDHNDWFSESLDVFLAPKLALDFAARIIVEGAGRMGLVDGEIERRRLR